MRAYNDCTVDALGIPDLGKVGMVIIIVTIIIIIIIVIIIITIIVTIIMNRSM